MGKSSRDKGKRGERELAQELRRLGCQSARRAQQYCGSESSADLLGIPGIHIECKRTEALSLYTAYEQAKKDSVGSSDIPVVIHRRNHHPWVVIMGLDDWFQMYHAYRNTQLPSS